MNQSRAQKVQPVKNSTRENKMNIPLAILASAATIGLLADLMLKENFHTNTMAGFGVPALTIALSLATCLFACASKLRTRRHGLGFLIPAVVFSLAFLLRDSPTLLLIDFAVIVSALAFASYSLMGTPLAKGGLLHYASALVSIAITPTFNTIELLVREINWREMMSETSAKHLTAVLKGLAIATPLVGIFLGLFTAADPAFAAIAQKSINIDLGDLSVNMIIFSIFTWLSAGFLHGLSIFRCDGYTINPALFDEQRDQNEQRELSENRELTEHRAQTEQRELGGRQAQKDIGVFGSTGALKTLVAAGAPARGPVLRDGFEYEGEYAQKSEQNRKTEYDRETEPEHEYEHEGALDKIRFSQLSIAERNAQAARMSASIHNSNYSTNIDTSNSRFSLEVPEKQPRFALGLTELATVLGSVNVLFATFVAVQLRYLFGGASLIEITPGLSYAEYVHKGFFELNTVVALVLPMLLMADSMLIRKSKMGLYTFRLLAGTQIALVLVILGSALMRMGLYQTEFGQSELRLYVTVFMGWLGTVCAIFAATVLSGKRQRFAFASYLSGVAILLGINLANPDALIQTSNMALSKLRPQDVGLVLNSAPKPLDTAYALSLSSDGIPPMIDAIEELPKADAKVLAKALLQKHAEKKSDWRLFNLSRKLANNAIKAHKNQLTVLANSNGIDE
ncbi:MAG: hypothetical protein C0508_17920 [Cyanobacteria bacterium PR.023]|nr:hypothetical protein [Cyanobacteria bacterium PR.023]